MEDSLRILANAVIMSTVHNTFGEEINESTSNLNESLAFLHKSFENLLATHSDSFVWEGAREEFVENFSRLALKSQAQVGHNGNKTFADLHGFVSHFVENNSEI